MKVQDHSPVSFEALCFRLLTAAFGAPSHAESVQGQAGWGFEQPERSRHPRAGALLDHIRVCV